MCVYLKRSSSVPPAAAVLRHLECQDAEVQYALLYTSAGTGKPQLPMGLVQVRLVRRLTLVG